MRGSSLRIAYVVVAAVPFGCQALLDVGNDRDRDGAPADASVAVDATSPADASASTTDGGAETEAAVDAPTEVDGAREAGVNIVVNGGFESGCWLPFGGSSRQLDAGARTGAYACEVCGPINSVPEALLYRSFPVPHASTGYTARAYLRTSSANPLQALIYVKLKRDAGDLSGNVGSGAVSSTWEPVQMHDNRPVAAGDTLQVNVGFVAPINGVDCVSVDDVTLELD